MKLSIIIINFNTNKLTIQLIDSIKQETSASFELIVIDNSSDKENPVEIKKAHPDIRLIQNKLNLGFGRANNIGMDLATGKYVLLLNSDTIIVDKALDKCLEFMESVFARENNIGLLGCKIKNRDGSLQVSTFSRFSLLNYLTSSNPLLSRVFTSKNSLEKNGKSQFVGAVSGAFMMFDSQVLKKIKWFDPDVFLYSEETEFCRHRVSKVCQIYYWNQAEIIHFEGSSAEVLMDFQKLLSYSLMWYKRGILYYPIYIFWSAVNIISEVLLFPFTSGKTRKNTIRKTKNYLKALPILFFDIPRYSREWGSRPGPLKVI